MYSSHTLVRQCSKFSKLGFGSMWTENFQIFKLDSGRGIRDQIAKNCWVIEKAREFQKNIYFRFINHTKAFDCVDHNKLWKILKEMGIPVYLTCFLRNLYFSGQEATVRTRQGTGSKLGKEYVKAVYCHPVYLTCMQNISCKVPGWMKHKAESRLQGEISIISDVQMSPPLWQKVERN